MADDPTSAAALLDAMAQALATGPLAGVLVTTDDPNDPTGEAMHADGLGIVCRQFAAAVAPTVAAWLRARSEHVPDAYDSRYGPDIDTARGMCRALDEAADAIDEAVTSRG